MNKERAEKLRMAARALFESEGGMNEFSCNIVAAFAGWLEKQSYAMMMGKSGPLTAHHILSVADYTRWPWLNRKTSKTYRRAQEFRAMLVLVYAAAVEAGDVELKEVLL